MQSLNNRKFETLSKSFQPEIANPEEIYRLAVRELEEEI